MTHQSELDKDALIEDLAHRTAELERTAIASLATNIAVALANLLLGFLLGFSLGLYGPFGG